jgi:hypothetical protein
VGRTSEGYAIVLNTEKIEGTYFKLYTLTGNNMYVASFYASCGETRLFSRGDALYTQSGRLISEEKEDKEIRFSPNSPAGRGMTYVCKSVNARGW